MKYLLKLYLIFTLLLFTSCRTLNENDEPNNSPMLNMKDLALTILCDYPNSENENTYFILFVQSNGDIYSSAYSFNSKGIDENNFHYKLYTCDASAIDLVTEPELLGTLSNEDIDTFNNYLSNVDIASEYYDREKDAMGIAPDVIERAEYTVYCYMTDENGLKYSYHIISYGKEQGISYETYDDNAAAALDIVKKSEFFDLWEKSHNVVIN